MTIVVTGASGGLGMRVAQRLTAYAAGNVAVPGAADPHTASITAGNAGAAGGPDPHTASITAGNAGAAGGPDPHTASIAAGNAGAAGGAEQRVRLLFRDPRKVPDGVDAVIADYGDRESVRRALDGVDTVFMVSAAETPERVEHHRTFIDAAAAAGVRHLVYTSFLAAGPESTFTLGRDHWHTEEHIRRSGLAFTQLRDNLYSDFLTNMVGADGVIRGPAANGRASVVARDDVADVAAAVLRDPAAHEGRTYELTGPAALTLTEAAAIISAGTGREVRYQDETIPEAYASRQIYDAPAWQVDAWVTTYTAIAAGDLAKVTTDVERLTGHPATSLADLLGRGR